jgi:hypothetical protein
VLTPKKNKTNKYTVSIAATYFNNSTHKFTARTFPVVKNAAKEQQ